MPKDTKQLLTNLEGVRATEREVVIYEPVLAEDEFDGFCVMDEFAAFKG